MKSLSLPGRQTELVEGFGQDGGDFRGLAAFNVAAVQHVYRLAVLEEGDGWRGGRVIGQAGTQVGDRGFIATGKNGGCPGGTRRVLQSETHSRPGPAGGAAAHGIHNHEHGTASRSEQAVYILRSSGFFDTVSGEILAHRGNKLFGVGHPLMVPEMRVCLGSTHKSTVRS